jgi:hypothetical protein
MNNKHKHAWLLWLTLVPVARTDWHHGACTRRLLLSSVREKQVVGEGMPFRDELFEI